MNKLDIKTNSPISNGAIGYSGQVTISAEANGQVLFTKHFHNNGYKALFRFLCECLAGDYQDADKFKPVRIAFFHNTNINPRNARASLMNDDFTELESLSGAITTDTAALVYEKENTYETRFHFTVPSAYIAGIASNPDTPINQIMLYASQFGSNAMKSVKGIKKGLCAYYLCTQVNPDTQEEEWDPISLESLLKVENTNLIIEWSMSFTNID